MLMILNFLISLMSFCQLFLNHPLSMGIILLIQTIFIAMFTGLISLNFWFSYLLFLVMIGGMLILFMYMTSIASNEKFKFSKMILFFLMIAIFILPFLMNKNFYMKNLDSMSTFIQTSTYEISPNKYFLNNSKFMLIMMIIYLFITLIAIVNISSNNFGPLRQNI